MPEETQTRLLAPPSASAPRRRSTGRVWAATLVWVSLAVACWSRLSVLSQSLWHDEVVTVERYVLGGPSAILFGDFTVNNHMVFSILAWASGELLSHTEAVWRLWSVIPGLAGIAVLAAALWRWVSPTAGGIAAVLLTVSPLHHSLVPQARGYGLAFLAASGMVAGSLVAPRRPGRGLALFGISGWIGIATLPVMVLPFLGHGAALALRPGLRKGTVLAVGVVGAAALGWYLPVLGDLLASADQQFGVQLPWHGPLTGFLLLLPPVLSGAFARAAALATTGAAVWLLWRRDRLLLADLAGPVLFAFTVLTVGRFYVADRFVSALLVPLAALLGAAGAYGIRAFGRRGRDEAAALLTALVGVVLLGVFTQYAHDVNRVPFENFKQAAQAASDYDVVFASSARPDGLEHYVGERLELVVPDEVASAVCRGDPPLAYIEHPYRQPQVDSSCLRALGAAEVVFPQRGRGGLLRVWLLGEGDRNLEQSEP